MKRRLIFLFRYFSAPHRVRRWILPQTILLPVILVAFFTTLAWSEPPAAASPSQATPLAQTATPARPGEPTHTPLPPEFLANANQTIGISIAAVVLVLIVVIGVVSFMPQAIEVDGRHVKKE